jgi:hypothetical protein
MSGGADNDVHKIPSLARWTREILTPRRKDAEGAKINSIISERFLIEIPFFGSKATGQSLKNPWRLRASATSR